MRLSVAIATSAALIAASCTPQRTDQPLRGELGHVRERTIDVDVYSSASVCAVSGRLRSSECAAGYRLAMAKHPAFAEKFAQAGVCDEVYGPGSCKLYSSADGTFASPRPAGFLVCRKEPHGCTKTGFAPIYENQEWGKFTGADGGYLNPDRNGRFKVSGRVRRVPVI